MLYFRQIFIMLASIYTVRVLLDILGVEDYGIYNVVAGVVAMFGFFVNSMATASQRYFSFELGREDFEQLKKIFSLCLIIYVIIAIVVLLLAETIGLWFVNNKLSLPQERKNAALWVYQFSILSFLFTILAGPYMSVILAHEEMNIYAYVSIVEAVLKLGSVFLMRFISMDKLWLHSILLCVAAIIHSVIYGTICTIKYKECRFGFYWNKALFKEIMGYMGWNVFGGSVGIIKHQAVNILLNQFFNPIVVAARGIASSVNNAVALFFHNFNAALRPQIIKHYAAGQKNEMLMLVFQGSKGNYFLMYLFALPFFLEMPLMLSLWLKNLPEYAVLFSRLALIETIIDSITYPIMAAAQATGKIKLYQSVVGSILLLNFPISWIALSIGAPAWSVMAVAIGLVIIAFGARLFIVRRLINLSLTQFFRNVLVRAIIVSALALPLPLIICHIVKPGFPRLLLTSGVSALVTCCLVYIFGLNKSERSFVKNIIMNRITFTKTL
jgi:O-antigen/teichoic acid export membrane protein